MSARVEYADFGVVQAVFFPVGVCITLGGVLLLTHKYQDTHGAGSSHMLLPDSTIPQSSGSAAVAEPDDTSQAEEKNVLLRLEPEDSESGGIDTECRESV